MILRAVISIIRGYFVSSLKILKLHVSENGSSTGGVYHRGETRNNSSTGRHNILKWISTGKIDAFSDGESYTLKRAGREVSAKE